MNEETEIARWQGRVDTKIEEFEARFEKQDKAIAENQKTASSLTIWMNKVGVLSSVISLVLPTLLLVVFKLAGWI